MPDPKKYLAIGEIVREHGIHGAVKVYLYGNQPTNFRVGMSLIVKPSSGEEQKTQILKVNSYQNFFLTQLSHLKNPEDAKLFRKAILYIDRGDLVKIEDGEYYLADLLGFLVCSADKGPIGKLIGLEQGGSSDLLLVEVDELNQILIPFVTEWILKIDPIQQKIVMNLPDGLVDVQKEGVKK